MSFLVPFGYLEEDLIEELIKKCTLEFVDKYGKKTALTFYEKTNKGYSFPQGLWKEVFVKKPNVIKSEKKDFGAKINLINRGMIDQNEIFTEACDFLEEQGNVLINLPTNSGKTSISVYLASHFGLKTLIVCSLTKVLEQWRDSFVLNTKAKICLIESSKTDFSGSDILICTPYIFSALSEKLKNTPLIICDEIHSHTKKILKTLLRYRPKYLVGLTATMKRKDSLHKAFPLYFSDNVIQRKEVKEGVKVYKVDTNHQPIVQYKTRFGKKEIDYVSMISDICLDEERNQFIADHLYNFLSTGKVITENEK